MTVITLLVYIASSLALNIKRILKLSNKVGCFMSHHAVWNDALSKGYKRVMILEDDAAFVLGFMRKLKTRMMELENVQWDFLYLARSKVFRDAAEEDVPMTDNWVHPSFSTWTLHYVVSDTGKLLAA